MSLTTLRLMQEHYREEEAAQDRHGDKTTKELESKIPEDEAQKLAELIFEQAIKDLKNKKPTYFSHTNTLEYSIEIKPGTPRRVGEIVLARLRNMNLIATRHHNYGHTFYDFIKVVPPTDFLFRIK